MRAVAGCLQVLQRRLEGKLDERAVELIGHAVDGAARMQTLIEGLLAFSRVGTRGGDVKRVELELVLATAIKNLSAAVAESGAQITHDPLPAVRGDALQLAMLFQNLLANAIKFRGEAAPRVRVGAVRDGADWRVSVRDNGIGIDPEFFERIFVIFQRLHTRTEYPGTGIGLALCRKIAERHGGRLWVESAPGQGADFLLTLPAADPPKADPP